MSLATVRHTDFSLTNANAGIYARPMNSFEAMSRRIGRPSSAALWDLGISVASLVSMAGDEANA